jgi:hypothetical protein
MALTKVSYAMIEGAAFNVLDFGAIGDGTTDDTVAIQAAAAALQANGGGTLYFPPGTYVVFSSTTGNLCAFSGLDGVSCIGYGATIEVNLSKVITTSEGIFFRFDNCKNITVDGFTTNGPTLDVGQSAVKGYEFVRCVNGCRNISMPNNYIKNMISGLICSKLYADPDSMRSQNITIGNLTVENCWYGINGQFSGDFLTVASLRSNKVHRGVFFYGASFLTIKYWSKDPQAVDCLFSTEDGTFVTDVKLHYISVGDSINCQSQEKILLRYIGPTAGTFRDIDINVDDFRGAGGDNGGATFMIRKYNGGVPDPSDRGHVLQNLKISGSLIGVPTYNSGGGFLTDTLSTWGTGENFSNISLENLRIDSSDGKCAPVFFFGSLKDQMLLKNVSTAGLINISQSQANNRPPFTGKVLATNVVCSNLYVSVGLVEPLEIVQPFGATATIYSAWAYKTVTNSATGGDCVFTLPAATVGLQYTFARTSALIYDLDPSGSEIIRGGTAGQKLRMNTDGNMVTLACYQTGIWEVIASQGAYSFV